MGGDGGTENNPEPSRGRDAEGLFGSEEPTGAVRLWPAMVGDECHFSPNPSCVLASLIDEGTSLNHSSSLPPLPGFALAINLFLMTV